jgi:DNA invertase Pin-like site-specific DNA recombinase
MFQMLGVFAEFERAMIQERVRAGLARAKAGGQDTAPSSHPGETERAVQAALKKKRYD